MLSRLRFWWIRRKAGYPVPLGTESSRVGTYSGLAWLREDDRA